MCNERVGRFPVVFSRLPVIGVLLFWAASVGWAQAPTSADSPPPESEVSENPAHFPPLMVEPAALSFPNDDFAAISRRIMDGSASMPERRMWYRAAERYAPFEGVPVPDWKIGALEAGAQLDPWMQPTEGDAPQAPPVSYTWSSLGPNGNYDVSGVWGGAGAMNQGRSTALWTHMNGAAVVNKNIIFLGFADGGLWKSTNAGTTWTVLCDFAPAISVGSIDVLPGSDTTNYTDAIIYIGTGEGNFSQPDKDGVGVLKSLNGGATWTLQKLPWRTDNAASLFAGAHRIRRLKIDTNIPNAQSVWVAGDGGVYHTANGGASWSLVTGLPYSNAPVGSAFPGTCANELPTDFAVNTANLVGGNSTLLAVYGRIQDSSCIAPPANARMNNGVYRSTDGGTTWTKITISGTNGFPAIPGTVGRISLLSAPSNPKHVYLLIARSDNYQSQGIFESTDSTLATVTWTPRSTTNYVSSQGWYDMTGAVDPTNENKLMVGGLDVWMSTNNGTTLTVKSAWNGSGTGWSHADHHHGIYVDATTYYDANDGGLNVGTISGTTVTWSHKNAGGLSTLQFYGLSQGATTANRINAGLQDNGHAYNDGTGNWRATAGGDGGMAATDQTTELEAYEEYVYATIANSSNGGASFGGCFRNFGGCTGATACSGGCIPDSHTAFIANFMLDFINQNVMYVGSNFLYRNDNPRAASTTWTKIFSSGTADFVGGSTSTRAYISIIHTPKASTIISGRSAVIYVGTSTGKIWRSLNGGTSWTDMTSAPLPTTSATTGRYLSWIDTDPTNINKVIVTYSGWSTSTVPAIPGHVFRSLDGGSNWTDISGLLPDEPFNTLAVNTNAGDNNQVFVGSDTAVYVNDSVWTGAGTTWTRVNSGLLPHVSVNMMQFTNATSPKRLRLATHGRGIWELFMTTPLVGPPSEASKQPSQAGMLATKSAGNTVDMTYAPACKATTHTIYAGRVTGAMTGVNWTSSYCDIGVTGFANFDTGTVAPGELMYWVVAGQTAAIVEGSYGSDSGGTPRPEATFASLCNLPVNNLGTCP